MAGKDGLAEGAGWPAEGRGSQGAKGWQTVMIDAPQAQRTPADPLSSLITLHCQVSSRISCIF